MVFEVEISGLCFAVNNSVIQIRNINIIIDVWLFWYAWWAVLWLWNIVAVGQKWGIAVDLEFVDVVMLYLLALWAYRSWTEVGL